jgi:hypothetical protein
VSWTTASEKNNRSFTLQRSDDGNRFSDITTLAGRGNTNSLSKYEYTDNEKKNGGMTYYRLLQTDFDGTSHISPLISGQNCEITGFQVVGLSLEQTPGTASIFIRSEKDERFSLNLCNSMGQSLYVTSEELSSGTNHVKINTLGLSQGMYYLYIKNNSQSLVQKIVIGR